VIKENHVPPGLARYPSLERLDLSQSRITDAGLETIGVLKGLKFLELSGTQITDVGLGALRGMTQLELLGLRATAVTGENEALAEQKCNPNAPEGSIARLKRSLPKLKIYGKQ
jgi:Leucine-rich repeat (LRR) protein